MNEENGFIDTGGLDSDTKEFLQVLKEDESIRVIRGYKGMPSFVVEDDDVIVGELRPTDNSNYILYRRNDSEGLVADKKADDLNQGLTMFVDSLF